MGIDFRVYCRGVYCSLLFDILPPPHNSGFDILPQFFFIIISGYRRISVVCGCKGGIPPCKTFKNILKAKWCSFRPVFNTYDINLTYTLYS